jgi:hypothetical protein
MKNFNRPFDSFNGQFDKNQIQNIFKLLQSGDSDVVIIPYFDALSYKNQ